VRPTLVAGHNNGKNFNAVKDLIFQGFAKVTKEIWAGLVRRTYANEDAFIEKFHIPTTTDINDMIIALDTENEGNDEQSSFDLTTHRGFRHHSVLNDFFLIG